MDSDRAIILQILVGGQLRAVRVRLIGDRAGLLLRMNIIGELRIAVDFGKRNVHIWKGEWKV